MSVVIARSRGSQVPDNRPIDVAHSPGALRQRAEQRLLAGQAEAAGMSADELRELVRQRQIAQLELQIHNEELRASQLAVAEACDHYRELFDYAPVGYLTLDGREAIREANNAAAAMLGAPREELIGKRLPQFVAKEDRELCRRHIRQAVFSAGKQSCELMLPGAEARPWPRASKSPPSKRSIPAAASCG